MFLKLTETATDDFRIIEVKDCIFRQLPEPTAVADPGKPNEMSYRVVGRAFLMNNEGRTIETFPRQTGR